MSKNLSDWLKAKELVETLQDLSQEERISAVQKSAESEGANLSGWRFQTTLANVRSQHTSLGQEARRRLRSCSFIHRSDSIRRQSTRY